MSVNRKRKLAWWKKNNVKPVERRRLTAAELAELRASGHRKPRLQWEHDTSPAERARIEQRAKEEAARYAAGADVHKIKGGVSRTAWKG